MLESTSSFGRFEFRPLEPGFGMTVGNALRRILLSSLEGYADHDGEGCPASTMSLLLSPVLWKECSRSF